jgi:hypothetical protein
MAFEKGNRTNYKIKATLLPGSTDKSFKFNCEGDVIWIPKSQCNFIPALKELEIPEWLFREKFPNG